MTAATGPGQQPTAAAPQASGPLLVLTAALLWGTVGPARALAQDGLSAVVVGGWRQLLGGMVLLVPLVVRRARPGLLRLASRPAVLTAAAATGAYQVLFLYAVTAVGAGLATAVALGVAPAATGICSWLWQRDRPGGLWAVSTAICVAGTTLLLSGPTSGQQPNVLGLLAALGAGLCYGIYTVAARIMATDGADVTAVAAVTLLLGGLPALPWMAVQVPAVLHSTQLVLVLWLGVITCGAAYWCFMRGMTSTSASAAGTLSLAEPIAAVALSVALLGEKLTVTQASGCALVVVGLAITATRPARQPLLQTEDLEHRTQAQGPTRPLAGDYGDHSLGPSAERAGKQRRHTYPGTAALHTFCPRARAWLS